MRRMVKRAALGLATLAVIALLAGVTFEQWSRWRLGRSLDPPGTMIDVEGRGMHLHCLGAGAPVVVLEAGFGADGSSSWEPILSDASAVTRVCAYDRAGILWSEPGRKPRDAYRLTDELHGLLTNAGEPPPYVMVGHSLGGPLVRVYADRFPDDVVGMVLVDSSHPEQMERFPPEIVEAMESMLPSPLLMRSLAATGVLRWMNARRTGSRGEELPDPVVSRLPESVPGLLGEIRWLDSIMVQAGRTSDLGDLPMVVLSAGRLPDPLPPGVTDEMARQMAETLAVLQRELASLSSRADHRVIDDAMHYIHHDRPDAVIAAITDVVMTARGDSVP